MGSAFSLCWAWLTWGVVRTRADRRFVGTSVLAERGPSGRVDDGKGAWERLPGRGNDGK